MRRACVSLVLGMLVLGGCDRGSRPGNIGKLAPEFVLSDGVQSIDLNKMRGKVVVVSLWATWCDTCVEELPSLVQMTEQIPGVTVVGVSMDEDEAVYRRFLTKHGITFASVRDPSGRVNALYGTEKIPETYVIDRQGILRRKFVSAQNWTSPEIMDYLKHL